MREEVVVICRTVSNFGPDSFSSTDDKLSNSIIAPKNILDDLNLRPYQYVVVRGMDVTHGGVLVPIIPFDESNHPTEQYRQDDNYEVCLRTNLRQQAGIGETEEEPRARIVKADIEETPPLYATRTASYRNNEPTGQSPRCYLHSSLMAEIGLENGSPVEVYNTNTGGRIPLSAHEAGEKITNIRRDDGLPNFVKISSDIRKLLDVKPTDQLKEDHSPQLRVRKRARHDNVDWVTRQVNRALEMMVGRNVVQVRVRRGYDRDEHRNIVRANKDLRDILAIETGDKVFLQWYGDRTNTKCLEKPDIGDGNKQANTVTQGEEDAGTYLGQNTDAAEMYVPSTLRDEINVGIGDCVTVYRDMWYTLGSQVVLSLFGIFGVFVGGKTITSLLVPGLTGLEEFLLLLALSILVVWVILWPERQKCV